MPFSGYGAGRRVTKEKKKTPDSERRLKKDRFMANRGLIGKFMLLPFSLDFLTEAGVFFF